MAKRTKMIKTRCKYKDFCGQSKKIILLFVPGQLTLCPSPPTTHPVLSNSQSPQRQMDLPQTLTQYRGQHKGSRKAQLKLRS